MDNPRPPGRERVCVHDEDRFPCALKRGDARVSVTGIGYRILVTS